MLRIYALISLALAALTTALPAGEDDVGYFDPGEMASIAPLPITEEEIVNITSAQEISSAEILSENPLTKRQFPCVSGVYMIVARGSGEPQGTGRLSAVVQQIGNRIRGSAFTSVVYPATIAEFGSPLYPQSVRQGIQQIQALIQRRVGQCPNERIVLLGYSQGANVVSTGLAGSPVNARLPPQFARNIRGVAMFACPTQAPNQSYNLGTAPFGEGLLGREVSLPVLNQFANRMRQWCDLGDRVCARNRAPFRAEVHTNVVGIYATAAANFIARVA